MLKQSYECEAGDDGICDVSVIRLMMAERRIFQYQIHILEETLVFAAQPSRRKCILSAVHKAAGIVLHQKRRHYPFKQSKL